RSLREGDRLPPETELARQFGVNRSTVREALRELESRGLVKRRPGSKLMSVSRPQHHAVAAGVRRALVLHDVTFMEVWEALTILEPPIAEAAARARTIQDLTSVAAATELFAGDNADSERAVHHTAEFFRCVGRATHNQVLGLAQEPLLQLLEPSLRVLIDKVPQARSRIATAQRRIVELLRRHSLRILGRHEGCPFERIDAAPLAAAQARAVGSQPDQQQLRHVEQLRRARTRRGSLVVGDEAPAAQIVRQVPAPR